MKREFLISIVIFVGVTLLLLPNFYRNRWTAVEPEYYAEWQARYDRLVVARLVKTRQDGFLSAGGLLGLGDVAEWNFDSRTHRRQFNAFINRDTFQSYLVYRSNPGLQGVLYGAFDRFSPFSEELTLRLMRVFTATATALVFSLILTAIARQFGLLPMLLTLAFTVFSMWIVLPAGSIFWNYWGFYLPFLASAYLLDRSAGRQEYRSRRILFILFIAALLKTLVSGFDLTTTVLIMATVPLVFHAVYHKWEVKVFIVRLIQAGAALAAGTAAGMMVLMLQIMANENNPSAAYEYLLNRFTSHMGGDYEYFYETGEARAIGVLEVLPRYLLMPAVDLQVRNVHVHILYWHLIVLFALFTLIFILKHRMDGRPFSPQSLALAAATWYSLLAPLSWYVLFRPHSYIHTHVNTMGWQMPFTLLGFALCGHVLSSLFTGPQATMPGAPPSPS